MTTIKEKVLKAWNDKHAVGINEEEPEAELVDLTLSEVGEIINKLDREKVLRIYGEIKQYGYGLALNDLKQKLEVRNGEQEEVIERDGL